MSTSKISKCDVVDNFVEEIGAVKKIEYLNTSILEKALAIGPGVYHYIMAGDNYNGNDLPSLNYKYTTASVYKRTQGAILVILHSLPNLHSTYERRNFWDGEVWSGWITDFLPLVGGTMSGNEVFINEGLGAIRCFGTSMLLESRNEKGNANIRRNISVDNSIANPDVKNALWLNNTVDGNTTGYKIFGEHNKPSGSYTGNGSTTQRVINTGGIGTLFVVSSTKGGAIVTPNAAYAFKYNDTTPRICDAYVSNGTVYMNSADSSLNENGVTYYWTLA